MLHNLALRLLFFVPLIHVALHAPAAAEKIPVLILDGQNNHDWEVTSEALHATLRATGMFDISVSTAPQSKTFMRLHGPKDADESKRQAFQEYLKRYLRTKAVSDNEVSEKWQDWLPEFSKYRAVLMNYSGRSWSEAMQKTFVDYVRNGGGLVLIHASNNTFSNWPEFNDMIGLGYGGNRGALPGQTVPCTKINDESGQPYQCCAGNNSGHGSQHPFLVKVREADHPIMKGLPPQWRHGRDELYHNLRGPGKNLTVLSSAYSDPKTRGTGHHEPMTWAVRYGKGRVVVTSMGHFWKRQDYWDSLYCVGFQAIVARSMEYTATGAVTLDIPASFPGAETPVIKEPHLIQWTANGKAVTALPGETTAWREKKKAQPLALLTPDEERESFVLPEGFHAELVASEPMVQEPVLCVWDADGAMYVAEMRSYMQDEKGTGTKTLNNGRVKKLVDVDGDGRMDKATVFVDGLNLPRMILPLDDRIAVVETDDRSVWSYRDTDNDGKSDEKQLLYKGSRGSPTQSVEHQDSGLIWNLDNWIYISYNHSRYRFTDGTWRTESQPSHWSQWGLTHDDIGRIFYSTNNRPAVSIQVPRMYWDHVIRKTGRKPRYTPTVGFPYDPEFLKARNLCERDDRGGNAGPRKTLTSVCGQSVFRGDALPIDVYGDYFVCDPTIHVVRRARIDNRNGKLHMTNVYGEDEFMLSSDFNFRPVNTCTGPDGCLYVVDMYRGIIQDSPWYSGNATKFAKESGINKHIQNGRIWRIRHRDHLPRRVPTMSNESTAQLIRHFEDRNGWVRDTAQKLIILREDRDTIAPLLEGLLRFDLYAPLTRLHALWTLDGMNAASRELLIHVLKDRDWRLRAAAIRIGETFIRKEDSVFLAALESLSEDKEPEVAKQIILSLGWLDSPSATALMERAVRRHITHDGVYLAAMASMWGNTSPLITSIRKGTAFKTIKDEKLRSAISERWNEGIAMWERKDLNLPKEMTGHEKWLISNGERIYFETCRRCHGPNGKGQLLPGADTPLAPSLVKSPRVLGDPEKLIRILLHGLAGPIEGKTYAAGVMPPIASLGQTDQNRIAQVANYIRFAWGHNLAPIDGALVVKVRTETAGRKNPWTLNELGYGDAESAGKPSLESQLSKESTAQLAADAHRKGDALRGADLFYGTAACFPCHDAPGEMPQLGPNVTDFEKKTPTRHFAESILTPSKVIRPGFQQVSALVGEEIKSGLKLSEDENMIELRLLTGQTMKLQKNEIDKLKVSETSVMPAGLVNLLKSRQDFLDLVKFLIDVRDGGAARLEELKKKVFTD